MTENNLKCQRCGAKATTQLGLTDKEKGEKTTLILCETCCKEETTCQECKQEIKSLKINQITKSDGSAVRTCETCYQKIQEINQSVQKSRELKKELEKYLVFGEHRLNDGKVIRGATCENEKLIKHINKISLVEIDKPTYLYEREEAELQEILKWFVPNKTLKWQKIFQTEFYKEIFRLWNIPFTAENIRKKPRFICWATNELIYKNMPENSFVSDEPKKTLKKSGNDYNHKLHQSLTLSGRENLKKVIYSVETLASISKNWSKFSRLMKEKFHPERNLPYIDLEAMDSKEQETDFDQMLKVLLSTPPIRRKRAEK
jgi:hypothetical protein